MNNWLLYAEVWSIAVALFAALEVRTYLARKRWYEIEIEDIK